RHPRAPWSSGDSCHCAHAAAPAKLCASGRRPGPPDPSPGRRHPSRSDFRQLAAAMLLADTATVSLHGIAMNDSAELLKQLRIERDGPGTTPPSRKGLWIAIAVAVVVLLALLAAWLLLRGGDLPEVRTAQAAPLSTAPAAASVLDASGYVVARRMATVSAKVTGRVQEVLIEEGMRVEEGQVLARLDPV